MHQVIAMSIAWDPCLLHHKISLGIIAHECCRVSDSISGGSDELHRDCDLAFIRSDLRLLYIVRRGTAN